MPYMFYAASAFNQDLSSTWDVSNVTNMTKMFQLAFAFNQNLCIWATKSPQLLLNASVDGMFLWSSCNNSSTPVLNSGIPDMHLMFRAVSAFNQVLSAWDVSSVKDMELMFYDASAFNQDLSAWDVSNVTNMIKMFQSVYGVLCSES
eukprot:scaffold3597_cov51-Attheya_sp.AAC.1